MDPVLDHGLEFDQGGSVAQELAQISDLPGRDVCCGDEVGPQQMREDRTIDLVGLHLRFGDSTRPERVRQRDRNVQVLEQIVKMVPVHAGLNHDVRRFRHVPKELGQCLAAVGQLALSLDLSQSIHLCVEGVALMNIKPDVLHRL